MLILQSCLGLEKVLELPASIASVLLPCLNVCSDFVFLIVFCQKQCDYVRVWYIILIIINNFIILSIFLYKSDHSCVKSCEIM